MKVTEAFPSKYLKADDLGGRTVRVTISGYEIETLGQGNNQQRKPVLYFRGKEKGLVLNKTNATAIAMMHGADMDDWKSCDIELFEMMTNGPDGKPVNSIRVRPLHTVRQQPAQGGPRTVGTVTGYNTPSAEYSNAPPPIDDDVPF